MVVSVVISIVLVTCSLIYLYIKNKYNYWKKKNVPHAKPTLFLGNYEGYLLQKEYFSETLPKLCKKFPNEPFFGAYMGTHPVLIVQDPEMIKLITTKEFHHFSSRELKDYVLKETFGRGLIMAYGEDWKFTRTNLTPMFTTAKLKNMFHLIEKCSVEFDTYVQDYVQGKEVEATRLMAKYTMFCFVSCAFGVDLQDYSKSNEFLVMADLFFDVNWIRGAYLKMRVLFPGIFYGIGLSAIPPPLEKFFKKLLTDVFESRNYKASARNDFVDALLNLKNNNEKESIDDQYLIAQCMAIFAGGFETSATTLAFTLFEIAKNDEIQAKVHEEIDEYLKKTNGAVTFECINDLPYLDACMNETLRLYPILAIITREVTEDYTLPSGAVLEKGLSIHFPIYHIHRNPDFFPNPEQFNPGRFYGENKQEFVPYSYLPFGEGPRLCIGKRFAKMQTLTGLISVLRNHTVTLADGMPTTMEFEPKSLTTRSKNGIHLRFKTRNQ